METSQARITGMGDPWNGPLNLIQQDVFVKHKQFTKIQNVGEYDQEIPKSHTADQPHGTVRNSHRTFIVTIYQ